MSNTLLNAALAAAGYAAPSDQGDAPDDVPGGVVRGIVHRYAALVEWAAGELETVLSRAEWNALADANNGCADLWDYADGPQVAPLTMIWANVADTPELGTKWGIDQAELVRKLRNLGPTYGEAILAAVRWFWEHCAEIDHQEHDWWQPSYRRKAAD